MWDILELKLARKKTRRPEWRQNSHFGTLLFQQFRGQKMTSVRHSSFSTTDALRAYLCDLREEISDDENLIGLEKKQTREKKEESSCSASKLKCY